MTDNGCRSTGTVLIACFVLGLVAAPLPAQQSAPGVRPAPASYADDLQAMVDTVARRCGVRIFVDPAIVPAVRPGAPDGNLAVDKALDAIVAPLKRVAWRRVYLARSLAAAPDRLAAAVRVIDRPDLNSLFLENTATKRAILYLRDRALQGALGADPEA